MTWERGTMGRFMGTHKGLHLAMTGVLTAGMLLVGCATGDGSGDADEPESDIISATDAWVQAKTLDAALRDSGVKELNLPDSIRIGGMTFDKPTTFQYTDGWVSVDYENDDAVVIIDKWTEDAGGADLLTFAPEGTSDSLQTSAEDGDTTNVEEDSADLTELLQGTEQDAAEDTDVEAGEEELQAASDTEYDLLGSLAESEQTLQWNVQAGDITCTCFGTSDGHATSAEWSNPANGCYYRVSCVGMDSSLIPDDDAADVLEALSQEEGDVSQEEGDAAGDAEGTDMAAEAQEAPVAEEAIIADDADYTEIAALSMTNEEVVAIVNAIK